MRDPELSAILDQAARNLNSLELLVRTSGEDDLSGINPLRQRLEALRTAYRNETNTLTRQVIERAIDRRVTAERRDRAKGRRVR
jgi:undecaprenyl pyrophosphate synthase